jgi:pantetheine-phosphate adenylyltransferase
MGHARVAERSCRLFDKVIIAVAGDTYKNSMFSLDERMEFVRDAVSGLVKCEIVAYNSLTVELARQYGASAILRGLRGVSDYEYEAQVAAANKHLDEGIETVFLMADADIAFVSSSAVKQMAAAGGRITGLVTPMVEKRLGDLYGI